MPGRCHLIVEDLRLPGDLPRRGIKPKHEVVVACVDNEPVVDRDVAVVAGIATHVLVDIVGEITSMLPLQVARSRIDCLDYIARLRHIQDAIIGERGALLAPRRETSRPDHSEPTHVLPVHLIQRAVPPAVERATPHQPVVGRGLLEHRVGDGDKLVGGLSGNNHQLCRERCDGDRDHQNRS